MTGVGVAREVFACEVEPRPSRFASPIEYSDWAARADAWAKDYAGGDPAPWVSRKTGERRAVPDAFPENVLTYGVNYAPRAGYEVAR